MKDTVFVSYPKHCLVAKNKKEDVNNTTAIKNSNKARKRRPTVLKKLKNIRLVTRKMRTWDKTRSPSIRGDDFIK